MKRRIRGAIVGVSAIILVALGVPLAVAVHRSVLDQEVVEVQAIAATALAEIDVPIRRTQLRVIAAESDAPKTFAVYDRTGKRIFGAGPASADEIVRRALLGRPASMSEDAILVATPIVETGSETVHGALRVTESLDEVENRAATWYAAMVAAGLFALGLAWLIGNRLAKTLADPLTELAGRAENIGEGGAMLLPGRSSGIEEIDALASVLNSRNIKVNEALQRERQFSADVSHQLRTPVTALRLKLESAQADGGSQHDLRAAFRDLDRVDDTIEHLLAVARDATPSPDEIRLDDEVVSVVARWQPAAIVLGRTVVAESIEPASVRVNRASLDQVLDVLIDNALGHGEGRVRVVVRRITGGVAVDVVDEGGSIAPLHAERVFDRGHGAGTGIGLSVARAVAEAEGGRLVLTSHEPTTFSLLLLG